MLRNLKQYLPYLIIGVVFYLLDRENLFINDDLNYAMNHVTGEPVRNLFDAIQSQGYDWFHQNGRFIIHTLVQCFCGFLGSELFWVFNTLIFLFWLKGIVTYMNITIGKECNMLAILLLGAVMMVPAWNITNLGYISGAINYLWGGCAYLWFVIWYIKSRECTQSVSVANGVCIALVAMIVGSLQESFCIGIAGYFGLYYILHIKELKSKTAWMVIGFCIGAAICVLAPANFARLGATETKSVGLMKYVAGIAIVLSNAKTLVLMLGACAALWCTKRYRGQVKEAFVKHSLLISAACINALFVAVVAYTGAHQLTGIELFSLIVISYIIYKVCNLESFKYTKMANAVCYLLVLTICIPMWIQRHSIANAYKEYVRNIQTTTDGIVVATDYINEITIKRNWLRSNFVRSQESITNTVWPSRYFTEGKNDSLFHTILPQTKEYIIEACNDKNLIHHNIYKPDDYNFYIIKGDATCMGSHIRVSRKVTLFGEIRNMMQTGNPYDVSETSLGSMTSFAEGPVSYFIELDDQNYPVQNIEIIK